MIISSGSAHSHRLDNHLTIGTRQPSLWVGSSNIRPSNTSANIGICATTGLIPSHRGMVEGHGLPGHEEPLLPCLHSALLGRPQSRASWNEVTQSHSRSNVANFSSVRDLMAPQNSEPSRQLNHCDLNDHFHVDYFASKKGSASSPSVFRKLTMVHMAFEYQRFSVVLRWMGTYLWAFLGDSWQCLAPGRGPCAFHQKGCHMLCAGQTLDRGQSSDRTSRVSGL
jgi:hypothetical protein